LVTPIGRFTATLPRLVTNASTIVPGWARAINSPATAPSPLAVPSLGPVDLDQLGPTNWGQLGPLLPPQRRQHPAALCHMIPITGNRGAAVVAQICQNSFQLSPTNSVQPTQTN
jgi:hypothetical protein